MITDPAFWKRKVTLEVDVLTLMAMHGNLCLALRHPGNRGESRALIETLVKDIGKRLVELGALTPEQLKEAERIESEEQQNWRINNSKKNCISPEEGRAYIG